MYDPKIKISRLNEKIRLIELRLKAFVKWDAPKRLRGNKQECMVALKNQLCFLKEHSGKSANTLRLNKER